MPAKRVLSDRQWDVLLGFMEKHPTFAMGTIINESPSARRETNDRWAHLAGRLNYVARDKTGCTKTVNQWRDYWNHTKYIARKKEVIRRAQARAADGGSLPKRLQTLRDNDERVLAILGRNQAVHEEQKVPNHSTTSSDEEGSYRDSETCHTPSIKEEPPESTVHPNTNGIRIQFADTDIEPPQRPPSKKEEKLKESFLIQIKNSIDTGEQPPQHTPSIQEEKLTESFFVPITNSINTAETPLQRKQEEWEIFGKAVGIQMQNLDKTQLAITQKIISDTIYYAKFGMLTQKSHLKL